MMNKVKAKNTEVGGAKKENIEYWTYICQEARNEPSGMVLLLCICVLYVQTLAITAL